MPSPVPHRPLAIAMAPRWAPHGPATTLGVCLPSRHTSLHTLRCHTVVPPVQWPWQTWTAPWQNTLTRAPPQSHATAARRQVNPSTSFAVDLCPKIARRRTSVPRCALLRDAWTTRAATSR
eukprot:357241-Chlamydomonas_euryale.AAC.16